MQEVLQAAVAKMNGSNGASGPDAKTDPMGMIMALLPKLLENRESIEHSGEQLEDVRTQVRGGRKQVHRMHKDLGGQMDTLTEEVQEMREQLSTLCDAVLELANHLRRIEVVGDEDGPDRYDDDYEEDLARDAYTGAGTLRAAQLKRDKKPRPKPRKRTPRS